MDSPLDVTNNLISIPKELYRKLCQESVDLIKANRTIDKLKEIIKNRDTTIEKLKTKKLYTHLTPVGLFEIKNEIVSEQLID